MTILYLMTSPYEYAKLKTEIKDALTTKHISNPIRDAESRELPYLQACIKEGLRLWTPIASLSYFDTPSSGDTIEGVYIPAGTKVGVCWWQIARNKEIYGADADLFRPERWFVDAKKVEIMDRTVELVFKPGRWQCLGKSLALMEVNKTVFEVSEMMMYRKGLC